MSADETATFDLTVKAKTGMASSWCVKDPSTMTICFAYLPADVIERLSNTAKPELDPSEITGVAEAGRTVLR
ncbi:hypothetical protein [Bifidobacterium moukalabense]|uniref:hypothetical protein n=1 Tax=Bifidobacterium moukalabense TaxID=1333651 RepID=UPI0010F4A8D6|nr:hypothetical protein [Bifidobacterium moukalabense]